MILSKLGNIVFKILLSQIIIFIPLKKLSKDLLFLSQSQVYLFLINFNVRTLEPTIFQQIIDVFESPISAFVKSRTYKLSARSASTIFSYLSESFNFASFFLDIFSVFNSFSSGGGLFKLFNLDYIGFYMGLRGYIFVLTENL